MKIAAGIDVGGTKIASGLVDRESGKLVDSVTIPTASCKGSAEVLSRIEQSAKWLLDAARSREVRIEEIGIGIPELISSEGEISSEWNFALSTEDIHQALADFDTIRIDSDVRCGARAELTYGAGLKFPSFSYISIGTGISAAQIIDDKILSGARGFAIHFGTSELVSFDEEGGRHAFCLEEYASGSAIAKRWVALHPDAPLSAKNLIEGMGGAEGTEFMDKSIEAMASYLAQMVNMLDPHALVIGGGLGHAPQYFEKLKAAIVPFIWAKDAQDIPILRESSNGDAGVIGASLLTKNKGVSLSDQST